MHYQATFERYEIKYLLSLEEKEQLLTIMAPYMKLDDYGRTTIRTIYYDTDDFRLIRRAMEKPAYKEKLRIRSYQQTHPNDPVFVELKKKYDGIVYKRRVTLPEAAAMESFDTDTPLPLQSQIADEIEYFRRYYQGLRPQVLITYEREAYYDLSGSAFRVTFDENILYRNEALSLEDTVYGTPLLPKGMVLMEVKTPHGIPLWMSHFLAQAHIYKSSFSKYRSAYMDMMQKQMKGKVS